MLFQVISALFSLSPTTTGDLADFTNPTPATDVLTEHPFMAFLVVAVFCLIFGAIVALVYARTQRDEPLSTNFVLTLSALPMVIAILVMLVSDNIARAFSLAGIFALVRFRSVQSDPKDLTSVLFCMAIGLAGGLKLLAYSACGVVLFAVLMIAAWLLKGIGGSQPYPLPHQDHGAGEYVLGGHLQRGVGKVHQKVRAGAHQDGGARFVL